MFVAIAFFLLGIERFVYGFIYHFPEAFKSVCNGSLKQVLTFDEGLYWKVAEHIGVVIKVFQFGVIGYDLLFGGHCSSIGQAPTLLLVIGAVLAALGQLLNVCTFNAIGGVGVYYGGQLGYDVPWCHGFPYNIGINDPQYWGVVFFVWGVYCMLAQSFDIFGRHFVICWLETFWYITSMKLLEHSQHGQVALEMIGLKPKAKK